jgi:hypothetical protein
MRGWLSGLHPLMVMSISARGLSLCKVSYSLTYEDEGAKMGREGQMN